MSPAGPEPADEAWALAALVPGEQELWHRMSGPDRRHAVGVARDTLVLLEPDEVPREVIAAALLHDVGKVESSFGTFSRVGVTLGALAVGRTRLVRWALRPAAGATRTRSTLRGRIGLYLTHDHLGAELLQVAGSGDLTVSWADEHHWDPERWTVDARIGAALKAADGD